MKKTHLYSLLTAIACLLTACESHKENYPIDKAVYNRLPFEMEEVQLPQFPDYQVSITQFGVVFGVEVDVALHLDGARQPQAFRDDDRSSSLFVDMADGLVDGLGVEGDSVIYSAELGY